MAGWWRVRRALKWAVSMLFSVLALLFVLFLQGETRKQSVVYAYTTAGGTQWTVYLGRGAIGLGYATGAAQVSGTPDGLTGAHWQDAEPTLWLPVGVSRPGRREIALPIWIVLVLLVPALVWLWHDRRIRPGSCRCGYDLTGNVSGRCPECGAAAPTAPARHLEGL